MLKNCKQMKISLYRDLYDLIIPQNNLLRKIKESIDFSFINPILKESYSEHYGRPAKEPEMMFKLLFLKKVYDLSDERLVNNARVNMAYKYFLNLDPEDEMINSSLLTKFRKTRITEDILEELLRETIKQAIEKGLVKSTSIIVDSTHTKANAIGESPIKVLRKMTKQLRKKIYCEYYELSAKFPEKPEETEDITAEIAYSKQLVNNIKEEIINSNNVRLINMLGEIQHVLEDENIRKIGSKADYDARFGFKSRTNSFFGYKTHIAMTQERLISGIRVTSGEAADNKSLEKIAEQSKSSGLEIKEIIGDTAYSAMDNIKYCNHNNIKLISSLNPVISNAAETKDDGFVYNKDAKTMQCPAGHLAVNFRKTKGRYNNIVHTYHFSKAKCKACPLLEQCKVGQSKTKTRSITITSDIHKAQLEFEHSPYFKERMLVRYRIEAKNSELKNTHGLEKCDSTGITAMRLQSYLTAVVVNVKRIIKLEELAYS